jgi:hypothetical protein
VSPALLEALVAVQPVLGALVLAGVVTVVTMLISGDLEGL